MSGGQFMVTTAETPDGGGPAGVLVLERSRTFAMYLALLLRRMGLRPVSVETVAAARETLALGGVRIVLVGEPGDGSPISLAVRQLADDPSAASLPMVVIGVRDDDEEQLACQQAGCRAYLLRPVQPRQLHQALHAHLSFPDGARKHLRSTVVLDAHGAIGGALRQPLRLVSLSRGGALIAHDAAVPVGTRVDLTLPLPAGPLELSGSVIYNRRGLAADTPFAFAVLFHRDGSEGGEQIDSFLEAALQREWEGELSTPAGSGR